MNTRAPGPWDHPTHLLLGSSVPHPGWQPGGQKTQHARLGVLALESPDNPLAQCPGIKGQEWEGYRLRNAGGDRGRQCEYKDSDIKLRALKVKLEV